MGLSTRQISHLSTIDFGSVSPRMAPMREAGWVMMTNTKVKNPTGKGWGHVWTITPIGRGALHGMSTTKI